MSERALVVRALDCRDEIRRVDVTGLPENRVEVAYQKLLKETDTYRFFIADEET